jgi:hypothetical protein
MMAPMASRLSIVVAFALTVAAPARGRADTVGPFGEKIDFVVPDPGNKGSCMPEELGQLSAIAGVENASMVTVIGFKKTYVEALCCTQLHFVNLVLSDPRPPGKLPPGGAYIDPIASGDRAPWHDSEVREKLASETGEFGGPDNNLSKTAGWGKETTLDLVFGDKVESLRPGLEFVTLLVCADGKHLSPIAGVAWGFKADGSIAHLERPRYGRRLAETAPLATLQAALSRSGFAGYVATESCCAGAATPHKATSKRKHAR